VSEANKSICVLIADDHPVTRSGIRAILDRAPDIEVVGEARDGLEAERKVSELHPDVLLLDLVMPGLQPYEVEKWVRVNCPETITLVLTAHDRDFYLSKAIDAGVMGYLTKDEASRGLVQAIYRAVQGEIIVTGEQLARAVRWRREVGDKWESLTERESQVLQLLVQGLGNSAIAEALHVTKKTVECHVTEVLNKLDVSSRQEAIVWAYTHLPDGLR